MSTQLGFFTEPAPEPASPRAEHLALTRRLPPGFRVGTSTWSFPGWDGIVWSGPADKARLARDGLSAYAAHPLLRLVGVDRSWYAPVPEHEMARWVEQVPGDFRFVVKAARMLTEPRGPDDAPNPFFLDADWAMRHVMGPAASGLGSRLGVVVLQFTPGLVAHTDSPAAFADRLHDFLLGVGGIAPVAVELRSPGLLGDEYAAALSDAGASHCFAVHPSMPEPAEQLSRLGGVAAGPLVVRWMLRRNRRYEEAKADYAPFDRLAEPDPGIRDQVAELVLDAAAAGRPSLVSINNKAEGSAPLSAFALAEAVAGRWNAQSSEASHSSSEPSLMSSNRNVER
ncbi:MAG: DUF72 domain-containing protein [Gammaproteobacteria bacterium]